jgi:hypothetical protein
VSLGLVIIAALNTLALIASGVAAGVVVQSLVRRGAVDSMGLPIVKPGFFVTPTSQRDSNP